MKGNADVIEGEKLKALESGIACQRKQRDVEKSR